MAMDAPRPRRWHVAALLALVNPLVAYVYAGRPTRALLLALVFALWFAIYWGHLDLRLAEPSIGAAFVLAPFALALAAVIDVVRIALGAHAYRLRAFNRWWVYGLLFVASAVALDYGLDPGVGARPAIQPISFPSSSMSPTLLIGERGFADARAFGRSEPTRGDVVVFRDPRDGVTLYVKRIVGLPGDEVEMRGGVLFLNGAPVPSTDAGAGVLTSPGIATEAETPLLRETLPGGRSILVRQSGQPSPGDDAPAVKVPDGRYYVLGDNRSRSVDSRFPTLLGLVPRQNLIGRIAWIYWSPDRSRIGRRID